MERKSTLFFTFAMAFAMAIPLFAKERIIVVNEGNWGSDNGRLSYIEDGEIVSNSWFKDKNGTKLGDTPTGIIQVNDKLIAITVNGSNLVQFIDAEGNSVGEAEVANCRCLASDGKSLYVTSYAHEVTLADGTTQSFDKGFVAMIDTDVFDVTGAVEVGAEPEGIAYYDGCLFVANSGGYSDYESTVSVVDVSSFEVIRTVDTGQKNLGGNLSISGRYICIGSPGDYYTIDPATIILDCEAVIDNKVDAECFTKLDIAGTYNTTSTDGSFYLVGATFSYYTYAYEYNFNTIDPETVMTSGGKEGVTDGLPGYVESGIKEMTAPYGIYVNPYSGYIYATDAGNYASAGKLYQWSPEGDNMQSFTVYINPSKMLALNSSDPDGVDKIESEEVNDNTVIYNLQGIRVANPIPGQIYIRNGKKFIQK